MRKLIASINMTLDGYCDHEAGIVDDELHQHFNDLLKEVDTLLFGRITYQLMESSWPQIVANPTGIKPFDEFAVLIDDIHKIVFSHTLKHVEWKNSTLAQGEMREVVQKLKQQEGKSMLVGSPSVIDTLMQFGLIDEFRLLVHPIVLGKGLPLFKNIAERINLKLIKTKILGSGVIVLYYEPQ
ncbi:MAG: dihydrofolate reductase family protein [Paludibacter sp.]|nr:dihydrofolate reductase family protein [Paludibacter sp.]